MHTLARKARGKTPPCTSRARTNANAHANAMPHLTHAAERNWRWCCGAGPRTRKTRARAARRLTETCSSPCAGAETP
eukprot:10111015-Lingulodinium_polyedra.AAC.1